MDKTEYKKQVETLASDIYAILHDTMSRVLASALAGEGYRKLPEDSVVLTREEFESLIKPNKLDLQEQASYIRKEAAEKILNELLRLNLGTTTIKVSSNHNKEDIKIACQAVIDLIKDKLKEIATREGVEIKE